MNRIRPLPERWHRNGDVMLLVQTRGWDCAGALGVSTFQERYFLVTKYAGAWSVVAADILAA
jgi:hypothetical protein